MVSSIVSDVWPHDRRSTTCPGPRFSIPRGVTFTYLLLGKIIFVREHTSMMLGFYPINIIFVLACKMMPAAVASCLLQAASEKILVSYIYGPCFTNLSITSLTSISSSITVSTIYSGTIIMRLLERYHLHSPGFTRNGISFFPPK